MVWAGLPSKILWFGLDRLARFYCLAWNTQQVFFWFKLDYLASFYGLGWTTWQDFIVWLGLPAQFFFWFKLGYLASFV